MSTYDDLILYKFLENISVVLGWSDSSNEGVNTLLILKKIVLKILSFSKVVG